MIAINNSSNVQPATVEAGTLQTTNAQNVPKDPPIVLPTGEDGSVGAFLAGIANAQAQIKELLESNDKDAGAKIRALMNVTTPDITVIRIKQKLNQSLGPDIKTEQQQGQPLLQPTLSKLPTCELKPPTEVESIAPPNQTQNTNIEKALGDISKKLDDLNNSIKQLQAQLAEAEKNRTAGSSQTPNSSPTSGANPPAPTINNQKLLLQFIAAFKQILDLFEQLLREGQNSPSAPTSPSKVQALQKEPILV
jgi:hypothetical protein